MLQLSLMHCTTAVSRQWNFIYCGENKISFREGTGLVPILPVEQVTVFCIRWWISDTFQLTCGLMPRTTPLHPTLHASKLFQVIKKHLPTAHTYADCTQQLLSFKLKSNAKEKDCQGRLDVDPDVDLLCAVFTCQTFSWPLDFWWMFLPVSWLWCFLHLAWSLFTAWE